MTAPAIAFRQYPVSTLGSCDDIFRQTMSCNILKSGFVTHLPHRKATSVELRDCISIDNLADSVEEALPTGVGHFLPNNDIVKLIDKGMRSTCKGERRPGSVGNVVKLLELSSHS